MSEPMDYERLKTRQRAERHAHHPNLALRVHRALSWLHRAEQLGSGGDPDGQFLLLWIAFNAAYATEIDEKYRESEQQTFRGFLQKLAELDAGQKRFDALVWQEFPRSIRVLLDNPYVFPDFWRFHNGTLPEAEWKQNFDAANRAAHKALGRQDTVTVLSVVLSRIYTLRNQLIHGGATWNSSVNREQVRDCTNLMAKLVPLVIEVMLDHPEALWGDAVWPVVE
jgi:Apea-like HEPN